ncbi:alpha,alpha-trehalase [Chitinophaga dinghuensis]|uniref:Alpha,alpha-trehalase n=1 Tax=Chitinophaga dinghuensis TaxID=1539050 RepID=A0A327W0P7_9BACT|nr:alpha,alpha-trehalase TreF [Chitinophaga dinghuensis]RAJ82332.1 alpha,alpha-trehalase [Chitinophaga dinghuensis]
MKKLLLPFLLICLFTVQAQLKTPRATYPGLFEAVQMNRIYPDGKTFPDLKPKVTPDSIMHAYQLLKDKPDFNLKSFTEIYFEMPSSQSHSYHSDISGGIRKHIDTLWTVLRREPVADGSISLIKLPFPYIVPGGRFREVYYWDSYFTMLGLRESGKTDMVTNMLNNFAWLIDTLGFIPNGNRTYFLTRSQPPFFACMVQSMAETNGDKVYLRYLPQLLKEYAYWMRGANHIKPGEANAHVVKMPGGEILNRYWDFSDQPREESYREDVLAAEKSGRTPAEFYRDIRAAAESGWDFSSRWFRDPQDLHTIHTTDLIPVDLNALLCNLEAAISKAYMVKGKRDSSMLFQQKRIARIKAMNRYCWNEKSGWYFDYDWKARQQSTAITIAGAFPLFCDMMISYARGYTMSDFIAKNLLAPGGVKTTLVNNRQQWDDPNGWAPLQYVTAKGLLKSGHENLANDIIRRWLGLNTTVFNHTGKLMEKYNVEDLHLEAGGGEYALQDGFGWTNGVFLQFLARKINLHIQE